MRRADDFHASMFTSLGDLELGDSAERFVDS